MANTEEIAYGECCCCLEKLIIQYYLYRQPEIYEVLFKDTFDIVLKYPEKTKLICDSCIVQLRQANHFRRMVESSQQSLSDRVNWQPELANDREDLLEPLNTDIIKCELDNVKEEAANDVQEPECTIEELNYDAEIDIKENSVVEETSPQINSMVSIKVELMNDDNEDVPVADHQDIQNNSDLSTSSSDKLAIAQHSMETLKVHSLTRSPAVERQLSYASNCQYEQTSFYNQYEDKGFVCYFCPYKAARRGHLEGHLLTHTGEKPFSCDMCNYKTARKGNLVRHKSSNHGEKLFSCDICQYKTARKANLVKHNYTHHGENHCDTVNIKQKKRKSS